jgi:hypothetical protein
VFKKLADKEENLTNWLTENWAEKEPQTFWDDKPTRRWDAFILHHWPRQLSFSWWYYLFADLGDIPWVNLWRPMSDMYEMRYWLTARLWRWSWLWEETKPERILCRLRGHPEGEIYYNPGGFEPDHHCKTCGEEIG